MSEAILITFYLGIVNIAEAYSIMFIMFVITGSFVGGMSYILTDSESKREESSGRIKKIYAKIPVKTLLFIFAFCLMIPSKSDFKYIIGGSLVINGSQAVSQIEGADKLPKNLVNAMNVFLEDVADKESK